jgi:hypothetical protein
MDHDANIATWLQREDGRGVPLVADARDGTLNADDLQPLLTEDADRRLHPHRAFDRHHRRRRGRRGLALKRRRSVRTALLMVRMA